MSWREKVLEWVLLSRSGEKERGGAVTRVSSWNDQILQSQRKDSVSACSRTRRKPRGRGEANKAKSSRSPTKFAAEPPPLSPVQSSIDPTPQ